MVARRRTQRGSTWVDHVRSEGHVARAGVTWDFRGGGRTTCRGKSRGDGWDRYSLALMPARALQFSWATCIYMASFRCTSTRALGLRLVISSTSRSDGNSVFSRLGLKLNQWFSERPDTLDKKVAARNPCHKDLMKTKTITDLVSTSGMVRIRFCSMYRGKPDVTLIAGWGNQVNTCYRWQLVTWACIKIKTTVIGCLLLFLVNAPACPRSTRSLLNFIVLRSSCSASPIAFGPP